MIKRIFYLFLLICSSVAIAQQDPDSLMVGSDADTSQLAPDTSSHKWSKPKKAMYMSMLIPGLGQVYNGRTYWWKLPILYGGFTAIYALLYKNNQAKYLTLNSKYKWYYYNPTVPVVYKDNDLGITYTSISQLKTDRDQHRRYRDMAIFFTLSLYALNIMDAYVEAHLLDFDISDDLSLNIHPVFLSQNNVSFAPGLGLQLNFKNPLLKQQHRF